MEKTFKREITFLSKRLLDDDVTWEDGDVTKEVTFKELDRTDSSQHVIHFLIATIFEYRPGEGGGDPKFFIDHEKMYHLAVKSINSLMIIGDGITEADKTQILADSTALINFGDWFATHKATPFFIKSRLTLVK